jgi:hypothetical protein
VAVRTKNQPVEKVMASVTGGWGSERCEMENYKAQDNFQMARQILGLQYILA